MTTVKNMCSIHRFNYSGTKCPFCEQERLQHLVSKFVKPEVKEKYREVTQTDLERLMNKFNG